MVFCMKVLNKKWAFVELFPINFLLFVTLYFQETRKGKWVLKIDSMAKNEFQNSPHVLKTRYIMCWWHLNYILHHSEHLWIFTTSFRIKIRKVDLNLDLNQKSWIKSKKSLIWIFLKKIRYFSNPDTCFKCNKDITLFLMHIIAIYHWAISVLTIAIPSWLKFNVLVAISPYRIH